MQWSLFHCDSFYSFYVPWNQTVSSFFGDTRYIYIISYILRCLYIMTKFNLTHTLRCNFIKATRHRSFLILLLYHQLVLGSLWSSCVSEGHLAVLRITMLHMDTSIAPEILKILGWWSKNINWNTKASTISNVRTNATVLAFSVLKDLHNKHWPPGKQ
jgi:hypothetical protein